MTTRIVEKAENIAAIDAGRFSLSVYRFHVYSVLLMAIAPLLNKFAVQTCHPLLISLYTCLFNVGYTLLFFREDHRISLHRFAIPFLLIGGMNGMGIFCLIYSLQELDPATASFIGRLYVVFSFIFSSVFFNEKLSAGFMKLSALAFIGLICFSYKGFDYDGYDAMALSLLSSLLFAGANVVLKLRVGRLPSSTTLLYSNLVSCMMFFGFTLVMGLDYSITTRELGFVAASSFFWGFLGVYFLYKGLAVNKFSTGSFIRCFTPFVAAIYALPFFPPQYSLLNWCGIALMLFSVLYLPLLNKHEASS